MTNHGIFQKAAEAGLHPFEAAGMGHGPFKFVGMARIPRAEENNYEGKLAALPKVKAGMGTCACCGMAIMNVCLIRDGSGDLWGVGTDCVMKTGESALCDPVKIQVAKARREAARERREREREERRQRWLATVCNDAGETNLQRLERESRERAEAEERRMEAAKVWEFMLPILDGQSGGFCQSIAAGIRAGDCPRGRAIEILCDIYGKSHGRRGSRAYDQATGGFWDLIGQGED